MVLVGLLSGAFLGFVESCVNPGSYLLGTLTTETQQMVHERYLQRTNRLYISRNG